MQQQQRNLAPYGTPRRMHVLAGGTALLGVLILAWGVWDWAAHRSGGVLMTVIGAVLVLVAAVGIPLGRRRGKM